MARTEHALHALRPHIYRSRNQVIGGWLGGGFFVGLGVMTWLGSDVPTSFAAIACGLALLYLFSFRTGVWVTQSGIRVRNPFSSFECPWDKIKAFRIGRHGFLAATCLIDLNDGSSRYVFAIQLSNWSRTNPNAPEQKKVAELNATLESHAT